MPTYKKHSKSRHKKKPPLTHGWVVVPSKTYPDRVYYYNTITKCSTWKNPCEGKEQNESFTSSETSPERPKFKSIPDSFRKSLSRKQKSTNVVSSRLLVSKVNNDIEDYDEQDQYFETINGFNAQYSKNTPPSSPGSISSCRTEVTDSDKQSEINAHSNVEEKQLWVHFVSNPSKVGAKKSIALSDLCEPSTSKEIEMDNVMRKSLDIKLKESSKESQSKKDTSPQKRKKSKNKKHEKVTKDVIFKRVDKTPAQSRLLKLRKKNEMKIKELAARYQESFSKKMEVDNLLKGDEPNGFEQVELRANETNNSSTLETAHHSRAEYCEEMDWEPSSEESDVRNINVFRQQLEKANEISSDIFFGLTTDHCTPLPSKTHSLFLVLDTNIFVSCIGFVKELRDTKVPDLGYPVIYVPWRVLQELDHLKDTKIDALDKHIHANVRRAIAYLNENFKSRHPRVFGQSFEDFANMGDFEAAAPDDEILQTCIQFQKTHSDKKLILLTNDKNLESKAIVSGIEVYSKDSFQKKFFMSKSSTNHASSLNEHSTSIPNCSSSLGAIADNCLCEMKALLKDFISSVVETEMKIVFEGDWVKIIYRKPPWTLQDALDCLLKHWRSVFFTNFSKDAHIEAEKLYKKLFKSGAASAEDVIDIIQTVQRFILAIKRSQKEKRPYLDTIPSIIAKLSNLLFLLSPNQSQAVLNTSINSSNDSLTVSAQPVDTDIVVSQVSKVKNLFKDIWDSLRAFCCSLSDVMHSSGVDNDVVVQQIRLKLSQIIMEVTELVVTVEKIFDINVAEINEQHPLIVHFSTFLIQVYPEMAADLKLELTKCLAVFFTDFGGRSLLRNSLKDFKDFIQDLSNATEYFNVNPTR